MCIVFGFPYTFSKAGETVSRRDSAGGLKNSLLNFVTTRQLLKVLQERILKSI